MKLSGKKRRLAISEIVATLFMVGITLIAGAAVFGWINGQAATSENAYGASVANNVNFLNERFVVVSQSFAKSSVGAHCSGGTFPYLQCTVANFWIYNNGNLAFTLYTLRIKNLTDIPSGAANPNPLNVIFYSSCSGTQNCGYAAYDKTGTSLVCSNLSPPPPPPPPLSLANLGQGQLSSYQVSLPAACGAQGQLYLYDGLAYTFTFTGLYGNTFQTTLTVNG